MPVIPCRAVGGVRNAQVPSRLVALEHVPHAAGGFAGPGNCYVTRGWCHRQSCALVALVLPWKFLKRH
jgi:hypothetical protein